MINSELIQIATDVVQERLSGGFEFGSVGCALVSETGKVYTGINIDVSSGMGFCAEHNAIGTMITKGESKIQKIVSVRKRDDNVEILYPCGRCREFMHKVHEDNIKETEVLLDNNRSVKLQELLPYEE